MRANMEHLFDNSIPAKFVTYSLSREFELRRKFTIKNSVVLHKWINNLFIDTCSKGDYAMAKHFLSYETNELKIDIHAQNDSAFIGACVHGHIDIAKYLIELASQNRGSIDIYNRNHEAFTGACEKGYLDTAQWLASLDIDDKYDYDEAFRMARNAKQTHIIDWFGEYFPGRYNLLCNKE
jgi:hypothetical protein